MEEKEIEKSPFKVDLTVETATAIRQALDRRKIGYSDGAEEMFKWFVAQDQMLQGLVLGQIPEEYQGQIAKMVLDIFLRNAGIMKSKSKLAAQKIKP